VQLRTDLAVVVGGDMVCVDVVVTNPASVSYIEKRRRVPQEPEKLEVAAMAERVKQYKYRAAYNQNNHLKHIADNLVPFAVEATGTLGDNASKFVYGLAKFQGAVPEADPRIGWARRFFLNRVSVLCAKARAELVMLSQKTQSPDAHRNPRRFLHKVISSSNKFAMIIFVDHLSDDPKHALILIGVSRCPKHQLELCRKLSLV
jgi:hypothetical protein